MPWYRLLVEMDAKAWFRVEAEDADAAKDKFFDSEGDEAEFLHYSEEWPDEILEVREE